MATAKLECSEKERRQFLQHFLTTEEAAALRESFIQILGNSTTLTSVTFKNSNAADSVGRPFEEAYCNTEGNHDPMYLGSLFFGAMELLGEYVQEKVLPSDGEKLELLYLLTQYILNEDDQKIIREFDPGDESETVYCTVLANHLLSKLCLEKDFLINEQNLGQSDSSCPCDCRQNLEGKFGNTSVGNLEVWHGFLDVVLSGTAVNYIGAVAEAGSLWQFIAQCVVLAFLQKKNHPELRNYLIPSIGICGQSGQEFVVYMYDAENDVLLRSTVFHLLTKDGSSVKSSAILIFWLLVNYKSFSSELAGFFASVPRANFFETAKPKLEVYRKHVEFGQLGPTKKRRLLDDSPPRGAEQLRYHYEDYKKFRMQCTDIF